MLSTEYCSLAWFKLAELVTRREKERALSIYRLLSYAWNDDAYSLQMKGDLLWAFQDYERANEAYRLAARLYEQSGRCMYAGFLYENILFHNSTTYEVRIAAVWCFAQAQVAPKVDYHMAVLVPDLIQQGNTYQLKSLLDEPTLSGEGRQIMRQALVQYNVL